MKTKVIVNPKSAGSRTAKAWPEIEEKLKKSFGVIDASLTQSRGHAIDLARQAIKDGCERVVAVGGDGTCNEVVNGFFENEELINPDVIFSFVMKGSSGDFKKSFEISNDLDEAIKCLCSAEPKRIDIGKITTLSGEGEPELRYFLNYAGLGASAEANKNINESKIIKKVFPGPVSIVTIAVYTITTYKNPPLRIVIDKNPPLDLKSIGVGIMNGRIAGDMKFAPTAELDDGLFDVFIFGDLSTLRFISMIPKCFSGEFLNEKGVTAMKAKKIEVTSVENVIIDMDGETQGKLPATFEVVPKVLNICC